jgi:hypothetical protein
MLAASLWANLGFSDYLPEGYALPVSFALPVLSIYFFKQMFVQRVRMVDPQTAFGIDNKTGDLSYDLDAATRRIHETLEKKFPDSKSESYYRLEDRMLAAAEDYKRRNMP